MAKPDYSHDIEALANRSKRLRALVVDQKVGDGTHNEEQDGPSHIAAVGDDVISKSSRASIGGGITSGSEHKEKLAGKVQQVIESDNPDRLKQDNYHWSRRLTYLSTRIPEDMRNLIEDLLFILKKEARKELRDEPSLQDLAREAWADLLQKHKELFGRRDVTATDQR
jgi:hypothetical protein